MHSRTIFISWTVASLLATAASAQQYRAALTKDVLGQTPFHTLHSSTAGDVNGDGLTDLVFNGPRILINRETHFEELPTALSQVAFFDGTPILLDVDRDGDLDVLYRGSTLLLALNDGAGGFTDVSATHFPAALTPFGDPAFGDFDGDGDWDLITPLGVLLDNDGHGVFTDVTAARVTSTRLSIGQSAMVSDFDGDGDADFITSDGLHRNDGRGFFVLDPGAGAGFSYGEFPFPSDVDGDGDLDVVFTAGRVLRNDGGKFTGVDPLLPGSLQHRWEIIGVADFDSDGIPDVVLNPPSTGFGDLPSWWRNDGNGVVRPDQSHPLTSDHPRVGRPTIADLDHDGDLDLVLVGGNGSGLSSAEVLYNDGQGGWHNSTSSGGLGVGRAYNRLVADFDNDGDDDLLTSDIGIHRNTGNGDFVAEYYPYGEAPNHLASADFDQDGDLDLLGATSFWINDGSGFFSPASTFIAGQEYARTAAPIDVDGDGDLDAVVGIAPYGQVPVMRVLLNDGQGQFAVSNAATHGLDTGHINALASGDFDGDGDHDLAIGRRWPGVSEVYANDGTGVFAASSLLTFGVVYNLEAMDFDGDGDLDLTDNAVGLFVNNGAGSFTALGFVGVNAYAIEADDVDGDGDLDLWGLQRTTGWISLHLNDGANHFTDASNLLPTERLTGVSAISLSP